MAASPLRHTSGPPQTPRHYDPSTSGTWDGQLSHPDIAEQLSPAGILEKPPENWPSIIERDGFADVATVTFDLTGPESAVLRRILFRAGSASQGCWESLPNMGRYLGFSERTVRRSLARLLDLGLIHKVTAYHGSGNSNCYVPVMRIAHSGLSVQNNENEGSIPDPEGLHSGLFVQNDTDNGLAPGSLDSHSGLSVQNDTDNGLAPGSLDSHSGLSVQNDTDNGLAPGSLDSHSGLSVQNDTDNGLAPGSLDSHSGLSVQNDTDNGLAPGSLDSHSGHRVQNGENEASILDSVSLHSGLSVHQTEGTEILIDPESLDSGFQRSDDAGNSKITPISVHSGQRVQNGASPSSISDRESRMGGAPSASIPDTESEMSSSPSATSITACHVCGLPWTTDAVRHRTSIGRGLREFICDRRREGQISQSGGIDRLVPS